MATTSADQTAVDDALNEFRLGNPSWPRHIVSALEDHAAGAAVTFGVEFLRSLMAEAAPARLAELAPRLTALLEVNRAAHGDADGLARAAQEIWYNPGRDEWQTAVSKLYAALASRFRGAGARAYRKEVVSAVNVAAEAAPGEHVRPEALRQLYWCSRAAHG